MKKQKRTNFNACGDPMQSLQKATTLSQTERDNDIYQMRLLTGGIRLPAVVIFGDTIPSGDFNARPYK